MSKQTFDLAFTITQSVVTGPWFSMGQRLNKQTFDFAFTTTPSVVTVP